VSITGPFGRRYSSRSYDLRLVALGSRIAEDLDLHGEDELLRCLADPSEAAERRGKACLVAGYLRVRQALPILIRLVESEDLSLLAEATRGLSAMRSLHATRPLMNVVKFSKFEEVRNATIKSLGILHDKRANGMLTNILQSRAESEITRCYAAQALAFLPGRKRRALAVLIQALVDASPILRWNILNTLAYFKDPGAEDAIRSCLSDERIVTDLPDQPSVARAAAEALRSIKGEACCSL
jgi:HEAT repeat protein